MVSGCAMSGNEIERDTIMFRILSRIQIVQNKDLRYMSF